MKEKLLGEQGFEKYYAEIFGARWEKLKAALLQESEGVPFNADTKTYFLDSASILAALTLPLDGAKKILDMCAAPGGKTLVLARRMEHDAELFSNELSFERKCRLERVVSEHLFPDVKERVKITCGDGALLCKKQDALYDAILLDAPCSSERHVLSSPTHLRQWSPARVRSLAVRQWSLLSSAFRILKSGGFLLYSTCAISNEENSNIAKRLLEKFEGKVRAVKSDEIKIIQESNAKKFPELFSAIEFPSFEENEFGFSVLPDAQKNSGPIYFFLAEKL
ncbi:MAG: RsmB/NOP family class I SAM-dependent RNA methyltransferase [Treponema sp.]|nr:RsmB/NOP family class I SAM-dependent RNA methyltransferase [Treponema sp.]